MGIYSSLLSFSFINFPRYCFILLKYSCSLWSWCVIILSEAGPYSTLGTFQFSDVLVSEYECYYLWKFHLSFSVFPSSESALLALLLNYIFPSQSSKSRLSIISFTCYLRLVWLCVSSVDAFFFLDSWHECVCTGSSCLWCWNGIALSVFWTLSKAPLSVDFLSYILGRFSAVAYIIWQEFCPIVLFPQFSLCLLKPKQILLFPEGCSHFTIFC